MDETPLEVILSAARSFLAAALTRVQDAVGNASPATIRWSGLMGIIAIVYAYYQIRGNGTEGEEGQGQQGVGAGSAGMPRGGGAGHTPAPAPAPRAAPLPPPTSPRSTGKRVKLVLGPARRVTLATLGVLLEEEAPEELRLSCTVKPGAADVVKHLAGMVDVYLITQVEDDETENKVAAALKAAGLVGGAAGVKDHKLLFCTTVQGREAMVRQLEPDIHVDASASTVNNMARFIPLFLHVCREGTPPANPAPNVAISESLMGYFLQM